MSRAFTREDDNENALADIGERPISSGRNLVTPEGLAAIEKSLADLPQELARAEADPDRARIARDLRYWIARRESAELSVPEPDSKVIRFGMSVTIQGEDGNNNTWKIVGEDEADAAHGSISHVSPMARALFGKSVGDLVTVNGKEWQVVGMAAGG